MSPPSKAAAGLVPSESPDRQRPVNARVLAELCRRDLVPEVWVASVEDRALRQLLRRRVDLVNLRTSARNRIFGLLTQWGLWVRARSHP